MTRQVAAPGPVAGLIRDTTERLYDDLSRQGYVPALYRQPRIEVDRDVDGNVTVRATAEPDRDAIQRWLDEVLTR